MKYKHVIRLLLHFGLNILLVFLFDRYFPEYFIVTGGLDAFIIIGALITLMNLLIRPLLNIISFPLKLLATIIAIILVNGAFLWIIYEIVLQMKPTLVTLTLEGGIGGFIFLSIVLGIANWLERVILKSST